MGALTHYLLTRSAYGPGWDDAANARRLAMTRGVTIRSILAQTVNVEWIVLLHRSDPLLAERREAYKDAGARFIYTTAEGDASTVAFDSYRAGWAKAIGKRDRKVAMTRLDDDDAFAPWAMAKVQDEAQRVTRRTALMLPIGIRVWQGGFTFVFHRTNAMQTLVTPGGDDLTVYDYGHRFVHRHAHVKAIDTRPGWLWSRHVDTISGWRVADAPITDHIRAMFPVDWCLFDGQHRKPRPGQNKGRSFR